MSLQVASPYINVQDSNGEPYVGAKLYVYDPGTTTLASIYTDDGLSTPASNPATSNAKGNFPRLYIAAGTYKLRAETSGGSLIWQEDNIDTGLSAGTGALPISRGGTGGTTAAAARANLDVPSNTELSDLSSQVATLQSSIQNIVSAPQGRLTLTSATPVLSTGVSAGTAVYYTPYLGNLSPIYDGSQFNPYAFTELTLTLVANHVASNFYDVFLFLHSGSPEIGTGPGWSVTTAGSGARGTGAGTTELTRTIGGLLTNAVAITLRNGSTTYNVSANQATYIGTIFIDGTNGQVSCHTAAGQSRKWGVWNAYNRKKIKLKIMDSTATWAYGSTTIRQSNGAAGNTGAICIGLPEECVDISFMQNVGSNTAGTNPVIGVGFNSTTAVSGTASVPALSTGATTYQKYHAAYLGIYPQIGINNVNCVESGTAGTTNFLGGEDDMLMTIEYMA